jgi:tetratricopeptide (TPR) repeat protein
MGDVFAIQDEISAMVVEQLKLKLLGQVPRAEEIDPRAYDLYLRGRHMLHRGGGRAANEEARGYLEKVVELEPEWVPGIAELLRAVARMSNDPADEYRARGWALLEQLERVDSVGARALGWRGWLSWIWLGEPQVAARYLERSAAIDPANIDLLRGEAAFLGWLGRHDEAMAISEYLIINDPGCQPCIGNLVFSLRHMGRPREAAERLESILEWHAPTDDIYWSIGISWLVAGEPQKAFEHFDAMSRPADENLGLLLALHDLGRVDEFERDFARYREVSSDNPEGIARIYAWTGQNDEAFAWLERMVEQKGSGYAGEVKTDLYSKLNDDPRWSAFLERNGASDEDTEQISFQPTYPAAVATALREP